MASFSDFQKIELKVGKVLKIEDIEGKDKLYKLEVDTGDEKPRTLVAGLKEFYSKEQLTGKQIIVVTNLDPKPLAGIVSEGMLLATKNKQNGYSVVTVEDEVQPGAQIE
ncbi:methionine--tRNA ligase subunit beta [Candidatus Micrarchaeota archaeon]|nr:methionine--tRNA ligase subunit beta [Candidatus Micrarchaeota archaeon]MBU1930863.1 methionine--tRNA ligase subunit beta [Candidatus Micrarchaeota archaeon]